MGRFIGRILAFRAAMQEKMLPKMKKPELLVPALAK
jgi:hypothetical protein